MIISSVIGLTILIFYLLYRFCLKDVLGVIIQTNDVIEEASNKFNE